jgi:hypothetical protein
VVQGQAGVDAGGANVTMVAREQDCDPGCCGLFDERQSALVGRIVPQAAIPVYHQANGGFFNDGYLGIGIQLTVSKLAHIDGETLAAVTKDAAQIILDQPQRQEIRLVLGQTYGLPDLRDKDLHIPSGDWDELFRR